MIDFIWISDVVFESFLYFFCVAQIWITSLPLFVVTIKVVNKGFIGLGGHNINTDYWKGHISTVATGHGKNALFGFFWYSLFILGARHSFTTSQKKTFFVSFFCLFLIERCNIKLWKSSLKLIHLKYFLQKVHTTSWIEPNSQCVSKVVEYLKKFDNVFHLYLMR